MPRRPRRLLATGLLLGLAVIPPAAARAGAPHLRAAVSRAVQRARIRGLLRRYRRASHLRPRRTEPPNPWMASPRPRPAAVTRALAQRLAGPLAFPVRLRTYPPRLRRALVHGRRHAPVEARRAGDSEIGPAPIPQRMEPARMAPSPLAAAARAGAGSLILPLRI